jgi:hypothetical protein
LCRPSFYRQVRELVWQGIAASPGVRVGTMILPDEGELDVQLAYSPAVLTTVFNRYDDKSVDITSLMKAIQPTLTDQQIQNFCRNLPESVVAPPEEQIATPPPQQDRKGSQPSIAPAAVSVPQPLDQLGPQEDQAMAPAPTPLAPLVTTSGEQSGASPSVATAPITEPIRQEDQKGGPISTPTTTSEPQPITEKPTPTPLAQDDRNSVPTPSPPIAEKQVPQDDQQKAQSVIAPAPAPAPVDQLDEEGDYTDDFETLPQDNSPARFSLSFILVEIAFKNRPDDKLKSLSLEFESEDQGLTLSCPISHLEGQSGKRIIGDMDWDPIHFVKRDLLRTGGPVLVTLKNRNKSIGQQRLFLKEALSIVTM